MDNLLVDVEALVTGFLRGQQEVSALTAERIYAQLPNERTYPLIVLTRTGGGPRYKHPMYLDQAEITVAFLAKRQKDAWSLMSTACSALALRLVGAHSQGKVTDFIVTSIAYDPYVDAADPQGLGLPRYLVTTTVTTHP